MKRMQSGIRKHSDARPKRRIRSQRRNGYFVPDSFYWFPVTPRKIRLAAQRIVDALHPEKIILFGSFAYGKPTPDSDVDLLVVMDSKEPIHARAMKVSRVLSPRPFPVDLITRTPVELEERLAVGDCFFREITEEGIVIYERVPRRRLG